MRKNRAIAILISVFYSSQLIADISHIRVTWHKNPSSEAIISWTSDGLDGNSMVHIGLESEKANELSQYSHRERTFAQGKYSRGIFHQGPFYNHVKLNDLQANSTYYFKVQSGTEVSQEYWFTTAPVLADNIQLMFGGDSRTDYDQRLKMNAVMKELFERRPQILGMVHGGDYIYNGSSWPQWRDWLDHQQETYLESGRILPVIPTRGNHEVSETLYNEVWAWPNDGLGYFTSKIGDFTLLILNSEISVQGEQKVWLESQLADQRPKQRWLVANYHRPAYPAVKRSSATKKAWVPLFEKYSIDLAFESDGHVYKQTAPIYQDKIDEKRGIIYVGEGGLGVKQREPDYDRWYLQGGVSASAHHLQVLSISPESLYFEGIDEDFKTLSTLTLKPRQAQKISR